MAWYDDARYRSAPPMTVERDRRHAVIEVPAESMFGFDHDSDDAETVRVPISFEVCDVCDGRGSVVNPSIDDNGITASEMEELGDDFRRDYFGGAYDIACNRCGGERVVPVIDECKLDEATAKKVAAWRQKLAADAAFEAECRREREMGE